MFQVDHMKAMKRRSVMNMTDTGGPPMCIQSAIPNFMPMTELVDRWVGRQAGQPTCVQLRMCTCVCMCACVSMCGCSVHVCVCGVARMAECSCVVTPTCTTMNAASDWLCTCTYVCVVEPVH